MFPCHMQGCLAIIIIFGITVAGIDKSLPIVQRPVFASDATIAYKFVGDKELHFATALVVPALVLLATAAAMEFLVLRQQGWQKAAANFINIIFSVLATIAVVGFLTELFKRMCGRLRCVGCASAPAGSGSPAFAAVAFLLSQTLHRCPT